MSVPKPTLVVAGTGSSMNYLLPRLATPYKVVGYNSEYDHRFDGFTYNLALEAEAAPNAKVLVASQAAPAPAMPKKWDDTYKVTDYSDSFASGVVPLIGASTTVYVPKCHGGNEEVDDGEMLNQSYDIIKEYSTTLGDAAYNSTIVDKINSIYSLRTGAAATTDTYDGTSFAPYPGPSVSSALNNSQGRAMYRLQAAKAACSAKLLTKFAAKPPKPVPIYPTSSTSGAATQNVSVSAQGVPQTAAQPSAQQSFVSGGSTAPSNAILSSSGREFRIDNVRNRQSQARANIGSFDNPENAPSPYGGTINTGLIPGTGIDASFQMNKPIKRIVFETLPGNPSGQSFWLPTYTASQIVPSKFKTPLKVIGFETGPSLAARTFTPCDHFLMDCGVFGSVALLWQSGIGPKAELAALGLPCLLDLPIGQKVVSRVGFLMKITASDALVGGGITGTFGPIMAIDGADGVASAPKRRVHIAIKKETAPNTYTAKVVLLRPRSYGKVRGTSQWSPSTLPLVSWNPKYFSAYNPADPDFISAPEDSADIAQAVKYVADTFHDLDAAVTFQNPALTYAALMASSSSALITSLAADPNNFIVKNEYFGGVSIGKLDPVLNPVPKAGMAGIIKGTGNLRIIGAAATAFVKDKVAGVITYIPAADGDATSSNLVQAEYVAKKMNI